MDRDLTIYEITLLSSQAIYEKIREIRWNKGISCPHCKSKSIRQIHYKNCQNQFGKRFYVCRECGKRFNDLTGTNFSGSRMDIKKIFLALHLHSVNDANSRELRENLQISKGTAIKILKKFRITAGKIAYGIEFNQSVIELDDTAHWRDPKKKAGLEEKKKKKDGWHYTDERHVIFGVFDRRKRKAKLYITPDLKKENISSIFVRAVKANNLFLCDYARSFKKVLTSHKLSFDRVDHSVEYVSQRLKEWNGKIEKIHTNNIENTFKHWKAFRRKYKRMPRPEFFLADFSLKFCAERKKLFDVMLFEMLKTA